MGDPYDFDKNSFDAIEIEKPTYYNPESPFNPAQDQSPTAFKINAVQVKSEMSFPLELDIYSEVQNVLATGVFRNLENPILYDKLCDMMLSDRYLNLIEGLFWTIYVIKFQKEDMELLEGLRLRLGGLYSEYFSLLMKPKEELSNMGIFAGAYICHIMFFNLFPKEREYFDMRFILDCYHIVIYEVNGLFVSDFYIQSTIEKLFGAKFFHFEKSSEKKKKTDRKDFKNEPLLRNLNYDLKNLPQIQGGLDLAQELSAKLRKAPKKYKGVLSTSRVGLEESYYFKGNVSEAEKILKLTQPNEDKSTLGNAETGPYFPKLKFNCHQISPTISSFLDNSNNTLPFQKKKVIHYSNNTHIGGSEQFTYQPLQEIVREGKIDKTDKKKKNQLRGSVGDYNLNNRGDDNYLGYMSKDWRSKFKFELDMKYILDNVKPTLRGSHSVKGLFEDKRPLFPIKIPPVMSPRIIFQPEKIEEKKKLPETFEIEREEKHEKPLASPVRKDESHDKMKHSQLDESGLKSKLTRSLSPPTGFFSSRSGNFSRKGTILLPQIDEPTERLKSPEKNKSQEDFKKSIIPETLKYTHRTNKKLGKGRAFVSLSEQVEEKDLEHERRFAKKEVYKDKRRQYIDEHNQLIRKDVDANIEDLVHKLLVKKNTFNKNFGKVVHGIGKKR